MATMRHNLRASAVSTRGFVMVGMLLASASAVAYSRLGQAQVGQHEGLPCFSLPRNELRKAGSTPLLQALSVEDAAVSPPREVWSFSHPGNRPQPLSPGHCIPYGILPVSATTTRAPAPLLSGRMYQVFLNAPTNGPTFGYAARFCLRQEPDGTLRVVQIRFDRDRGWTAAACQP